MLAQTAGSHGGQESQQHMCEPQVLLLTGIRLWLALHFDVAFGKNRPCDYCPPKKEIILNKCPRIKVFEFSDGGLHLTLIDSETAINVTRSVVGHVLQISFVFVSDELQ